MPSWKPRVNRGFFRLKEGPAAVQNTLFFCSFFEVLLEFLLEQNPPILKKSMSIFTRKNAEIEGSEETEGNNFF